MDPQAVKDYIAQDPDIMKRMEEHRDRQAESMNKELRAKIELHRKLGLLMNRFPLLREHVDNWRNLIGYIAPSLKPEECTGGRFYMYQGQQFEPFADIDGIRIFPAHPAIRITYVYQQTFCDSSGDYHEETFFSPLLGWRQTVIDAGYEHLLPIIDEHLAKIAESQRETREYYAEFQDDDDDDDNTWTDEDEQAVDDLGDHEDGG
ncbi:hypothetical protein COT97_04655 [Candidatus Falkowbacteria bacterium CG10_big_fil_rev_8_21_14_0_10_39_11]|uniref:Uncharacterized protein n=1 Tax=Candidatus Falkowbacteria bacterium CG10_big_fil_rev_8_21_14_0_10_39_11 TaxID=1974565 RepID=A0A2H0V400_9BACT|nr:MAG: hypothetical protein COT97_04655 [Candidatus Falkowbacteria bacterium CG10_big_fil_rev_8_21_14_0_10_39_11]